MSQNKSFNISFSTVVMIAVSIGAFILGAISYYIYISIALGVDLYNNQYDYYDYYSSNDNLVSKPDYSTSSQNNTYDSSSSNASAQSNTTLQNNTATASSESTSVSVNGKSSTKAAPLSIGEWGIGSVYSSGSYVDVPTRVVNVIRSSQAASEYQNFCNQGSTIYKYENAKDGMEWAVIEYEIDLSKFSSDVSAYLNSSVNGTGNNTAIVYNNNRYIVSTANMTPSLASGKIVTAKFATQLPIGCSDYIITLGSSQGSQAFIHGK